MRPAGARAIRHDRRRVRLVPADRRHVTTAVRRAGEANDPVLCPPPIEIQSSQVQAIPRDSWTLPQGHSVRDAFAPAPAGFTPHLT